MSKVRFATIEDVKSLSSILAKTWKTAYHDYISREYLESISDDRWVPSFTKNIEENLYEVVLYNLNGKNTGCITYGKARGDITCNTGETCSSDTKKISCESSNKKSCSSSKNNEGSCNSKSSNNSCKSDFMEAEIISLYVLPEYWSSKQGYELIKFGLDRLKSQGYDKCYLWVIEGNERAINFYKKVGFISDNSKITINLGGQDLVEVKYSIELI